MWVLLWDRLQIVDHKCIPADVDPIPRFGRFPFHSTFKEPVRSPKLEHPTVRRWNGPEVVRSFDSGRRSGWGVVPWHGCDFHPHSGGARCDIDEVDEAGFPLVQRGHRGEVLGGGRFGCKYGLRVRCGNNWEVTSEGSLSLSQRGRINGEDTRDWTTYFMVKVVKVVVRKQAQVDAR